ncbi:MAG: GTP-binding protein, partial [Clostridium sp.]|nr:GTP-binding protein [Clostridium sp.]
HHHDHDDHEHHHHHDHDDHEHHHHHDHDDHDHHHHHEHGEDCTCGCHDHDHHHHHADDVFTSWGMETANKYSDDEMKAILEKLADDSNEFGIILRAKGIVAGTGNDWIYFDLTPGEYEIRKGNPDYTGKLCVIGSELKEDAIAQLFKVV